MPSGVLDSLTQAQRIDLIGYLMEKKGSSDKCWWFCERRGGDEVGRFAQFLFNVEH